ncbi:hypothetical protein D3C86_1392870 [compost metagenome]
MSLGVMQKAVDLPPLPRLALNHRLIGQPVQDLHELPSRHLIFAHQLGFKKSRWDVATKNVIDDTQIEIFKRVDFQGELTTVDSSRVSRQEIAPIRFLGREAQLSQQSETTSNRRTGDPQLFGKRLLAQRITGAHRPGSRHIDDLGSQLLRKVFFYLGLHFGLFARQWLWRSQFC